MKKLRHNIKELVSQKHAVTLIQINCLIFFLFAGILVWKWRSLPPEIPLHYSLPRSSDQLVKFEAILFLPAFSLLFFILNFFLALLFFPKEKLSSILLMIISCAVSLLLFIAFIKIILLVT
jgi:uncharacterized membrane protein